MIRYKHFVKGTMNPIILSPSIPALHKYCRNGVEVTRTIGPIPSIRSTFRTKPR